jgi:hypothetical protein
MQCGRQRRIDTLSDIHTEACIQKTDTENRHRDKQKTHRQTHRGIGRAHTQSKYTGRHTDRQIQIVQRDRHTHMPRQIDRQTGKQAQAHILTKTAA